MILSVLLLGSALPAALPVRVSLADGSDAGTALVDNLGTTPWRSAAAGARASFLLDEPRALEAAWGWASAPDSSYRLLGSTDYREWVTLAEGEAAAPDAPRPDTAFPAFTARYLRFEALTDAPRAWELAAGTAAEVVEQRAQLLPPDWGDITAPAVIADLLEHSFDWQMAHLSDHQGGNGWVHGALYAGIAALHQTTELEKYREAIVAVGQRQNWLLRVRTDGKKLYHADDHCLGQAWLDLALGDPAPDPLWTADVRARLDLVLSAPLPGRQDWNWCDALFMAPPLYPRLAALTGQDAYRTFLDTQWWDVTDFLYDEEWSLFYRDSSYFDDREPNGLPVFWSRGNGWVAGGLVRVLQYTPADWPRRPDYVALLQEMSARLASLADPQDGLWSSSLLYPEKFGGEPEASGSAFFTFALAWGLNQGLLDPATYGPVVEKAWAGLTGLVAADGSLGFIQQIGAGPARYDGSLLTKEYGYGAFFLAGTEMMRYYSTPRATPYRSAFTPVGALLAAGEAGREAPPSLRPASVRTDGSGGTVRAAPAADPSTWQKVTDMEAPFAWTMAPAGASGATHQPDPYDPAGSRVFLFDTGNRTSGQPRASVTIPAIPEGGVATLYQRFAFDSPEIDAVFGVSAAALVDAYADYETGLRIYFDNTRLEARAGAAYQTVGDDLLQLGTWYEAWTVLDNALDTYDVYLRGGGNFPEITPLAAGIPFRNGTSQALRSFAISYNSQHCEGALALDDVYLHLGGVNLTRPAGVRQPAYSPWSDVGRDRVSDLKPTPVGWIWDDPFPWIYHADLADWAYVWPRDNPADGHFLWRLGTAAWSWWPAAFPGWYFDFGNSSWIRWAP